MSAERPFVDEDRIDVCITCPARILGAGEFNVAPTPSGVRYDRGLDYRVDVEGNPTCVHPLKIGLPPGNYIGGMATFATVERPAEPEPFAIEAMPYDVGELHSWLIEVLSRAPMDHLHTILAEIEDGLRQRFSNQEVLDAMRFALSNVNNS